jgi:2-iminobutanoate/2-iminopropanoate deaminase
MLLAVAALAGCAAGAAGRTAISTPAAPAAIGPYSQAIRAGDAVYVAGQLGLDAATGKMVDGGIEAETRQALLNVTAILAATGLGLEDVVQTQVFLADLDDFQTMNSVYAGFFSGAPPARGTIQAARLPRGARIEILAIAVRPGYRR